MTKENLLSSIGKAIQQHEGWYAGSRSLRNNNPGNLKYIGQAGAVGKDPQGFAVFPDYAAGWRALLADIAYKYDVRKLTTVRAIIARYAPPNENDTRRYADVVARAVGVGVDTDLATVIADEFVSTPIEAVVVRVKLVANRCAWPTLELKAAQLGQWFERESGGRIKLDVDIEHTAYSGVPFIPYPGNVYMDGVEFDWYDREISPRGKGYHIVMLLMNAQDWKGRNARGWRTDATLGCVELQIAANENEPLWFNGSVKSFETSAFFCYAEHEIMHALYMMQGAAQAADTTVLNPGCDNVHYWYNRGELAKAFDEIQTEYIGRLFSTAKDGEFHHQFRVPMWFGMRNNQEVRALQRALKYDGVYPASTPITGDYWTVTKLAVQSFQRKYRVAREWEIRLANGHVGPATRRKLNELFG